MNQSFKELEDYLYSQLPVFQNQGKRAFKPGLERISALLTKIDDPQDSLKIIHVGGTNGKGTVVHHLASVFQEAGYKVGLFTSPHFFSLRERIKINGEAISEERFVLCFNALGDYEAIKPSFFELLTAIGLEAFKREKVDIVFLEVGMGGRLDSTNVISKSELSIVTGVALDHCEFLGNTLEAIAVEKAGITKPGSKLLFGPVAPSVKENVKAIYPEANISFDENSAPDPSNERIIQRAIAELKDKWQLTDKHCKKGIENLIENTAFYGRYHKVRFQQRQLILDVAHNQQALSNLFQKVVRENSKKLNVLFAASSDKDVSALKEIIPSEAKLYLCESTAMRTAKAKDIASRINFSGEIEIISSSINEAVLNRLIADIQEDELFVVTGSFFLVADVLKIIFKK